MEKLIIAGAGPAGVSAALYATRLGITPLVIHNGAGALEKAVKIENYYGLPEVISGKELYENGLDQLRALQVPIIQEELVSVAYDGNYTVNTAFHKYQTKALILATGARRNKLTLKEAKKYEGSGISYCAVCDAFFYRGKAVAVLGNGEYALHEAKVLEPLASKVTILTNGQIPTFEKEALGSILVDTGTLSMAGGETVLKWIAFEDGRKLPVDGLFVALGTAGSTDIARKLGLIIQENHIMIEADTSTALPGFLAGTKAVDYLKKTHH